MVLISFVSSAYDPVEARQKIFKSFKNEMGAIKEIVAVGAVDKQVELNKHAQTLAKISHDQWSKIDEHFAKGTGEGKTDALPSIWEDFDAFRVASEKEKTAINNFVAITEKADAAEWKKGFGQVGGSCKGCHEKFRKD
jgi:cytochrome c556